MNDTEMLAHENKLNDYMFKYMNRREMGVYPPLDKFDERTTVAGRVNDGNYKIATMYNKHYPYKWPKIGVGATYKLYEMEFVVEQVNLHSVVLVPRTKKVRAALKSAGFPVGMLYSLSGYMFRVARITKECRIHLRFKNAAHRRYVCNHIEPSEQVFQENPIVNGSN